MAWLTAVPWKSTEYVSYTLHICQICRFRDYSLQFKKEYASPGSAVHVCHNTKIKLSLKDFFSKWENFH